MNGESIVFRALGVNIGMPAAKFLLLRCVADEQWTCCATSSLLCVLHVLATCQPFCSPPPYQSFLQPFLVNFYLSSRVTAVTTTHSHMSLARERKQNGFLIL